MKRLTKSSYDKKICGVCGGLGEYFNIDSNIIRVIMLVAFPYVSPLLIIYIIAAIIIPSENINYTNN